MYLSILRRDLSALATQWVEISYVSCKSTCMWQKNSYKSSYGV